MINLIGKLQHYTDVSPIRSEMIDSNFQGDPAPGKRLCSIISKNADIFTNFYIHIDKLNDETKKIKNFYNIFDRMELLIGGYTYFKLSLVYIKLYHEVIKGIDLEMLSDSKTSIIPINLKELVNIPFIRLSYWHEVRLCCDFHPAKIFDVDISRKVEYEEGYSKNLCNQPREIWSHIMSYLDDKSWASMRQTCNFFYFLDGDKCIANRYEKYKIDTSKIDINANIRVMYHAVADKQKENLETQKFLNQYRSIDHQKYIIEGQKSMYTLFQKHPVEWILLDVENKYYGDIIESIKFKDLEKDKIPSHFITEINVNTDEIYFIKKDDEFCKKMHNPIKGRYLIYIDNKYLDRVDITFSKGIHTLINVYISYTNWLCNDKEFCSPMHISNDCKINLL